MRSGSRFHGLLAQLESDGASMQSHKCSRISYSRGFLLSLGGIEKCRYLPRDFDPSMLHEFEDASTGLLKFPLILDSGHSGSLSRGLLRNPSNDRILGSGGCIATASSLKVQCSNDGNALKKSEKPYRPPHFYKVMSHSGRGSIDSFSEDTSGSDTSCERDMEERRRRKDSFHLTRKDQHTKTSDVPKAEDCGAPPASYGGSTKGLLSSRQPTEESVSASLEQTSGTKSPTISSLTEVANAEKCSGSSNELHETINGDSEESYQCCEPNLIQEVFTYLEQSVLSEADENNPTEHEQYKSSDDHDASSHLLTWLQCGIDEKDLKLSSEQSNASSESDELHLKLEGNEKPRNIPVKRSKSRFEGSLPHNLIHGTGSTKEKLSMSFSDEKAEFIEEIHLPDEDSLFTFDYSIAPQGSDSSTQADLARKLSALGLGMETYNVQSQQCHPQFNHSQVNPQTACFNPPQAWYPGNAPHHPYQQPCAWPGSFASPPPLSIPQFGQAPYQWQAFPQIYQQTGYGGHGVLPNPGFGGYNIQVPVNQLYKNENRVKNFKLRGKK